MALAQEWAGVVSCSSSVTDPYCQSGDASQRAARPSLQEWSHSQPSHTEQWQLLPHFHTLTMRGTKADSRKYGKVPEILLLSGHLSVFIEPVWTWDSLLKLLHACPPACSQQITNLLAETNWPGQYVLFLQRSSRQGLCFLHVWTEQNPSALGKEARCTLIAALITEFGSQASSITEHPYFLPCASPGWHRAPDESRDLGETSPGRNK